MRQALIDNEGLAAQRIEVIYNGIDPARFAGADAALRARTRADLGLTDGQLALLQVARFHSVKDHATALSALATALPRAWHARWGGSLNPSAGLLANVLRGWQPRPRARGPA